MGVVDTQNMESELGCRFINRLLCVASRWTVVNITQVYVVRHQFLQKILSEQAK